MFNDEFDDTLDDLMQDVKMVHISYKKRNRRKGKTMTKGLDAYGIDVKVLLKNFKKKLCCNGSYKDGVLELFGDHRDAIKGELINKYKIDSSNISMHGC